MQERRRELKPSRDATADAGDGLGELESEEARETVSQEDSSSVQLRLSSSTDRERELFCLVVELEEEEVVDGNTFLAETESLCLRWLQWLVVYLDGDGGGDVDNKDEDQAVDIPLAMF